MEQVGFESVRKVFRHRPALFNWVGRERAGETVALNDVSFSVGNADVVALLGPNGSGKTSTLKLISTMLLPDAGAVRVGGSDARREAGEVRRQVGIAVATERSFFPRLSARENLDFFGALDEVPRRERRGRIEEVLRATGLEEQSDTLVMKFSSGMYQKLGLARALVKRPRVLLLDEPTRSLDAAATAQLWAMIRAQSGAGTTVFVATHNFAEAAAVANRVLLLHRGELAADRILKRPAAGRARADRFATHAAAASQRPGADQIAEELRALYFRATDERDRGGDSRVEAISEPADFRCDGERTASGPVEEDTAGEELARGAGAGR
ncbi:MAG: ABC transporter ATP-binding protein [Terriglobales bacterium]|jgi:ABC-2 type transport system ATP-binding protein